MLYIMEGHHEVNRIQDRQSLQVHPFSLRHRSLCEFIRWLWRKRKSFSLHQMIQCLLQATEVSNSVGKADNDCTLILFSFRASLEFKKECVQCSSFNVCCWRQWRCPRPWRCPRASERQTTLAKWSFYVGSDHHLSSLTWKQRNVFNVHHLMSVLGGDEGVQERRKGRQRLQNDPFTLDQIIIWVHWLGSKGMYSMFII